MENLGGDEFISDLYQGELRGQRPISTIPARSLSNSNTMHIYPTLYLTHISHRQCPTCLVLSMQIFDAGTRVA